MVDIIREAAMIAARNGLMPAQESLDNIYKTMLMGVKALGFSEEEAVDIVQEAMQFNAEALKSYEVNLPDKSKKDLAFLELLGKLV